VAFFVPGGIPFLPPKQLGILPLRYSPAVTERGRPSLTARVLGNLDPPALLLAQDIFSIETTFRPERCS